LATALFDGHKPKPRRLPDRVLNHPATDPSARRNLIDAPSTVAVLANLIPDDPQHR
jgi:hypothetical protein